MLFVSKNYNYIFAITNRKKLFFDFFINKFGSLKNSFYICCEKRNNPDI